MFIAAVNSANWVAATARLHNAMPVASSVIVSSTKDTR